MTPTAQHPTGTRDAAPTKLTPKQREVLLAFARNPDGIYVNEPYFHIGRSNGKMSAALALVRKGLLERDAENPQLLRITVAGYEVFAIGASVTIPALGVTGTLVRVVPSSVAGGETRYRTEWLETQLNNAPRQAEFWLSDFDEETQARLMAVAVEEKTNVAKKQKLSTAQRDILRRMASGETLWRYLSMNGESYRFDSTHKRQSIPAINGLLKRRLMGVDQETNVRCNGAMEYPYTITAAGRDAVAAAVAEAA